MLSASQSHCKMQISKNAVCPSWERQTAKRNQDKSVRQQWSSASTQTLVAAHHRATQSNSFHDKRERPPPHHSRSEGPSYLRKTALADDGWFGRLAAPSSPHSSVGPPWHHRRSLLILQDPDDDLVSCTRTRASSILLCWILNMLYKINEIVRRPAGRPRKIWIWCAKENMKSLSIREDFVHHHSNWEWLLRKYWHKMKYSSNEDDNNKISHQQSKEREHKQN